MYILSDKLLVILYIFTCKHICTVSSKKLLDLFNMNIFRASITTHKTWKHFSFQNSSCKVQGRNLWVVVSWAYFKPHDTSGITINCTVNSKSKRFKLVIAIYVPAKVWAGIGVGSALKPTSFPSFHHFRRYNT